MIVEASTQTLDLRDVVSEMDHTQDGQRAVGIFPAVLCGEDHRAVAIVLGIAECASLCLTMAKAAGASAEQLDKTRDVLESLAPEAFLSPEDERSLFKALCAAMSVTLMRNGLEQAESFMRGRPQPPLQDPPSRANPEAN